MKLFTLAGFCLLLALPATAQDAKEEMIRFKKEDHTGVTASYDIPQGQTEDALEERLKSARLGKKRNEGGFWKYSGVTWPEIAPGPIDVYFDVDRHKGRSVVSMMVSPGNGNFATSATDPQIVEQMKAFLTKFGTEVIDYQNRLALAQQQKEVDRAARDLRDADRATDRANRRQKRADRDKAKQQQHAEEERKKLEELQNRVPAASQGK